MFLSWNFVWALERRSSVKPYGQTAMSAGCRGSHILPQKTHRQSRQMCSHPIFTEKALSAGCVLHTWRPSLHPKTMTKATPLEHWCFIDHHSWNGSFIHNEAFTLWTLENKRVWYPSDAPFWMTQHCAWAGFPSVDYNRENPWNSYPSHHENSRESSGLGVWVKMHRAVRPCLGYGPWWQHHCWPSLSSKDVS